jgi:hypothetical protein
MLILMPNEKFIPVVSYEHESMKLMKRNEGTGVQGAVELVRFQVSVSCALESIKRKPTKITRLNVNDRKTNKRPKGLEVRKKWQENHHGCSCCCCGGEVT